MTTREDLEAAARAIQEKSGTTITLTEFTAGGRTITAFVAPAEGNRAILEFNFNNPDEPPVYGFLVRPRHVAEDTAILTKKAIAIL